MTVAVSLTTTVALTFVPSVKEPAPAARPAQTTPTIRVAAPPVQLAAAVQPLVRTTSLPSLLVEWVDRIVVPPSASAPFPTPQFPPVVGGNSVGSVIKNTYNAVEPWVQWGFELVAYGVGWIPYVGWLAPQIMIFYNLGERIVHSITFNIADWLNGDVSFVQGLVDVGIDTINSFIFFANDQLAFWLPPLPPIPPIGPFAADEITTADTMMAMTMDGTPEVQPEGQVDETLDAVEPEAFTEPTVIEDTGEEAVVENAGEEAETAAAETELTEEISAEQYANDPTTSSSGIVQAQGEVRDAGAGVSPDEKTTESESPSVDDADEPDAAETSTTPAPESDDNEPTPDKDDSESE